MLFVIYLILSVLVALCVLSPKFRQFVAKLILGTLTIALLVYGACALQNAARAEDSEFYQIVAIIRTVEEDEEVYLRGELLTDTVVEVDDLEDKWEYFENSQKVEFDADKEMEDMALRFVVDNDILSESLRKNPLVEGRIVVIRMWTFGTDAIEDDEILGVYYTKFIAL